MWLAYPFYSSSVLCVSFVWLILLQRACRKGMGGHAALQGAERQGSAGSTHQLCRHANQHVQEGTERHTSSGPEQNKTSIYCFFSVSAGNTNVDQRQRVLSQNVKLEGYLKKMWHVENANTTKK